MHELRPRREERLDRLQEAIAAHGVLRLRQAAALLEVSEMTVRRDIGAAGGRFVYLGGYIITRQDRAPPEGGLPYVFAREAQSNAAGKRAACQRAAGLIEPDDTIFIDCGTTLPYLAAALPRRGRLTVVCYALNIADIVCRKSNATVMLLGGEYQSSSDSFCSPEALEMLGRIGITKGFFSAGGLHVERGASCSNFHEVAIKQAALRCAMRRYVVVDSSKSGVVRPAFFAPLDAFDAIVTDAALGPADHAAFTAAGPELFTAAPAPSDAFGT